MPRDDFPASLKTTLARRVSYVCSNPSCRSQTSGPHSDPTRSVNVGVACHITAAAVGGPRYDNALSPEERASIENAIWLCQSCAKLVDSDTTRFPTQGLKRWKVEAEAEALRAVHGAPLQKVFPQLGVAVHTPIPQIAGLTYDEAREKLIGAGWQPHRNHWSHCSEPDIQYGNGLHFWKKGFHEIIHSSGTGLGHCTFGWIDVYGNRLIVVTAGEVDVEQGWGAFVWNWYFRRERDT